MNILFFDTETIGLPVSWNAPVSHFNNYPRVVQLAWQLRNAKGEPIEYANCITKPDNFEIPESASKIHGITTEIANEKGIPVKDVLETFLAILKKADCLIAHNMEFDRKVLGAEFHRLIGRDPLHNVKQRCTMKHPAVVEFCKLPNLYRKGYKYPKLSELHTALFASGFDGAHDASVDVEICAKCFYELVGRGIVEI